MDCLNLKKYYKSGKFIFHPINKQIFYLNRVRIIKKKEKYEIMVLDSVSKKIITSIEPNIKKLLPKNSKLKTNIYGNQIFLSSKKIKILPVNISNIDEKEKIASVELYYDNIYRFDNNPNNFFYKLKLSEINYLD